MVASTPRTTEALSRNTPLQKRRASHEPAFPQFQHLQLLRLTTNGQTIPIDVINKNQIESMEIAVFTSSSHQA